MTLRIGIDLGGTKTSGVVLDETGRELTRARVATPSHDAEAIVQTITDLVRQLEAQVRAVCTVGIGTPGAISPQTGRLRNSNTTCLNGYPLLARLEEALDRPVRIANDANCFALSEAVDGAADGARVTFGVIVGTGTGGGIVIDGQVLTGRHAIAGEWGHMPLPWPRDDERPGPPCYCGRSGCVETWLSGPGLARDHTRTTGAELSPPEIARGALRGDASSLATLERYADRMARSLAVVVDLLDPDVIVLGGGLSHIEALRVRTAERLPRWVFSDALTVSIVRARHGDDSGVRGAAWLWGPNAGDAIGQRPSAW